MRDPSVEALIALHGGKRRIASAFAWYKTATSAAGALGKALAGALLTLTAARFDWVFLAAFALSVLPVLAVLAFVPKPAGPPPRLATTEDAAAEPARASLLRRLWPAMGFGLLVSGTAQMLRGLFPVLAVEHAGLTEAEAGAILLGATLVTLAAGPFFGWLADRGHRKLVLMVRSAANLASSAIYLLVPTFAGFAAAKAVDEAGKAAFNPAWGSLMAELAGRDPAGRGRAMGWLGASEDAGAVAGPIVAGLVWSAWGVGALLGLRMALAVVAELYAAVVLPRALGRGRSAPAPGAGFSPAS